jgi:hypothetical protein
MTPEQADAALATMTEDDFATILPEESGITEEEIGRLVDAAHRMVGRPSLTAPGKHSPNLTLRLPENMNERLNDVAARTGRRRSQIVREALQEYLKSA